MAKPRYTSHDAHGYRHGVGPCTCDRCRAQEDEITVDFTRDEAVEIEDATAELVGLYADSELIALARAKITAELDKLADCPECGEIARLQAKLDIATKALSGIGMCSQCHYEAAQSALDRIQTTSHE